MSKQTIWLITMLSLMVVLSAYYIVSGPVEPLDETAMSNDTDVSTNETNPLELTLFGPDGEEEEDTEDMPQEEAESSAKDDEEEAEDEADEVDETDGQDADEDDAPTIASDDFFMTMQAERSSINEQLLSKYEDIMTNPDSTDEQTEAASANMEKLRSSIEQVTLIEELIRGQGYEDALVRQEEDRYDITVQAEKMSKKEAVKILQAVQEETNVPASQMTISYRP